MWSCLVRMDCDGTENIGGCSVAVLVVLAIPGFGGVDVVLVSGSGFVWLRPSRLQSVFVVVINNIDILIIIIIVVVVNVTESSSNSTTTNNHLVIRCIANPATGSPAVPSVVSFLDDDDATDRHAPPRRQQQRHLLPIAAPILMVVVVIAIVVAVIRASYIVCIKSKNYQYLMLFF